jgi:hypothetical protein
MKELLLVQLILVFHLMTETHLPTVDGSVLGFGEELLSMISPFISFLKRFIGGV